MWSIIVYAYLPSLHLLWYFFKSLGLFLCWLFLMLDFECSLYILDISTLVRCVICKYFLQVYGLCFHSLRVPFDEQYSLILIKSRIFLFFLLAIMLFVLNLRTLPNHKVTKIFSYVFLCCCCCC